MGGGRGKGDTMGLGEVDRVEMQCSLVHVGVCVCVCAMCMCVCVLALLVGVGSHGQYPRTVHQTPKDMFVCFFYSWMLRALGVGYFS